MVPLDQAPATKHTSPHQYKGVMVSSTFNDLERHRAILMEALRKEELFAIGMEEYIPTPADDVISSSLTMIRKSSAYIGLISHRYGQIPECPKRNSLNLSVTRLEFEEAKRLELPTLIFVMGDEHPVRKCDVETDPQKITKLSDFRERAKEGRIYIIFNSIEEFTSNAIHSVANLRRYIEEKDSHFTQPPGATGTPAPIISESDPIPTPPHFYAEPPYIGSHQFIGRLNQLETLSDWATPSDSHCVLLIEAIGGTGKSMLTWEWATKYSAKVRNDWEGRFWYSFYEKGATMVDFCRRTLSYMTHKPRSKFKERSTAELAELLLHHLQASPWLLILDGLERILVSYHRADAAQIIDEEAGTTDKIARRDPCAAINPEDDDLLRAFAGVCPSKILLTSRLIPRVLLNKSHQPIPGVLREHLPGLRPADAESLIRACGITGVSQNIQHFLKKHCDCHPLVVGVLAGLINDYLPNRGDFDTWASDPMGGEQLNLANLDLVQKRNHILNAALSALPEASRQLLSTLALLTSSVDYATLYALNPFVSIIPEEIPVPKNPEHGVKWKKMSDSQKAVAVEIYRDGLQRREEYEQTLLKREKEKYSTSKDLNDTVKDLERRGLLQYDAVAKRYDLHPVVRGISAGGLKREEKTQFGQRVVDHFSQKAQDPYEKAESVEDFDNARHIVKVLLQMGKVNAAQRFLQKNYTFLQTLNFKFEAHNEILTIIRPFFSNGWDEIPDSLHRPGGLFLANRASVALRRIGAFQEASCLTKAAIRVSLKKQNFEYGLASKILSLASTVGDQNFLAVEDRLLCLANDVASVSNNPADTSSWRLARFRQLSKLGRFAEAKTVWSHLAYEELPVEVRPIASHHYAVHQYLCGDLTEEDLLRAEELNGDSKSALGKRNLIALRGFWRLQHEDYESAKRNLQEAIALAHKAGKVDRRSEICLAIAKYNLGELANPHQVAEALMYRIERYLHYDLACLWHVIGDHNQAKTHGLDAYKWAWADGIPYVRRHVLNRICILLEKIGLDIPKLLPYDSTRDEKLQLESEVTSAVEKLRSEREAMKHISSTFLKNKKKSILKT